MKKILIIPAICAMMHFTNADEHQVAANEMFPTEPVKLTEIIGVNADELSFSEKIGILIGNDMGRGLKGLPVGIDFESFLKTFEASFKATYQNDALDEMELISMGQQLQKDIMQYEKDKYRMNWDPEKVAEISEGFEKTESGLMYKIIETGEQVTKPEPYANVTVYYEGKLLNGQVFDSNIGQEPAKFRLNGVVQGWQEGLALVGKGGKVELIIPPELAYGPSNPNSPIPPWSTLVFNVELLDVDNTEPPNEPVQLSPEMIEQLMRQQQGR